MDCYGLRDFDLTNFLRKTWAAVALRLQTAAIPGRRPRVSAFQKLPVEVILDIMCHTASDDLKRLILTEKFMNRIFKTHKTCIFKRTQRYQFPEFLEWFGERPRFDGPVSSASRTSEQIQCLKEVVLSFNWSHVVPMTSGGTPARLFLHLLERYGGWRYLYFLTSVKNRMEKDAQLLRRMSLEGKVDMTREQAKAMVLCLFRMSRNPQTYEGDETGGYAVMSEVDRIAEVRMRVEDRLKFFRREPPALQKLMTRTLTILTFHIANELRLNNIATEYRHYYLPAGMGSLTSAQRVAGWDDLVSKVMAKTLLGSVFYFGISNVLRLFKESFSIKTKEIERMIYGEFERQMELHLRAVTIGTVPHVDSRFLAGSLWAAGLEFPTVNWFVTKVGGFN